MLLAYIDEIGETGAFIARDHERFNTSPAFGYAGFVVPAAHARSFGAEFDRQKRTLFRTELAQAQHPGRWERKGASIFRPDTLQRHPEQIRVFAGLVRRLRSAGGALFYYADEKPVGTPKQTALDTDARETSAMREALNRLARHAETQDANLMVIIDQVNEKTRAARLPAMYEHILGRAADHPEMRRIIELPMHVDSRLSANIQFADWLAACATRAVEYQLLRESPYGWVTTCRELEALRGAFTHESKLHLRHRSVDDFHHSELFRPQRPLHPDGALGANVPHAIARRIMAAAERSHAGGLTTTGC
ncbi:DUF3800 domain-containing protein [Curtobacterium pusillum]|uniref:DUF3800 domain-containing protein n=1 Tax=Curtobacterium pusillum TaxID=69373 RepID=UPI0011A4B4A7|nr:DUF3800 domain-containing protein [Curtobacterium pusillum]